METVIEGKEGQEKKGSSWCEERSVSEGSREY